MTIIKQIGDENGFALNFLQTRPRVNFYVRTNMMRHSTFIGQHMSRGLGRYLLHSSLS